MNYIYDHDLHIHSYLSSCSRDKEQNKNTILQYAKDNGLHTICVTDHFWDRRIPAPNAWYFPQNYHHISKIKPLPQDKNIRFLFGCEGEIKKGNILGISKKVMEELDFIVIPINHFHMRGFTIDREEGKTVAGMVKNWVDRFDYILDADLPFSKIGLAHLTCPLMAPKSNQIAETIAALPQDDMARLFKKAKEKNVGIELNADDLAFTHADSDIMLKPFYLAKEIGCKFYLGSDAHQKKALYEAKPLFERAISLLELQESDKIDFLKR